MQPEWIHVVPVVRTSSVSTDGGSPTQDVILFNIPIFFHKGHLMWILKEPTAMPHHKCVLLCALTLAKIPTLQIIVHEFCFHLPTFHSLL